MPILTISLMAADYSKNLLLQTITSKCNKYQNGVFIPLRSTKVFKTSFRDFIPLKVSNAECNTWSQETANNRKLEKTTQWGASQFLSHSSPSIRFFEKLNQKNIEMNTKFLPGNWKEDNT
jgi:hypothetical protein